jgi:hypothetical protein
MAPPKVADGARPGFYCAAAWNDNQIQMTRQMAMNSHKTFTVKAA